MAWRSESPRPSPMTWLAVRRSGTGSPMSRAACWMPSAMTAAESNSVPSQSKTISGYFLGVKVPEIFTAEPQHILRQRRRERDAPGVHRMLEGQPPGMQEEPLHALACQRAVEFEIAVFVVAQDREPRVREVHPDLVRASGHEAQLEDAQVGVAAKHLHPGHRVHPAFLDRHAPLAFRVDILVEGILDVEMLFPRNSLDHRDVDFFDFSIAQHAEQFHQRAAFFRNHEQSRGDRK